MNRDIFWIIFIGVVLAVLFFGFIRPIMDRGKDCVKNPVQQTCVHHPGPGRR